MLILLLTSGVLYIFAPNYYSFNYCLWLLVLFIISSIITIRYTVDDGNFLTFHVLFLLSFFFVNFVYPVILYPKNPFYFSVFKKPFDQLIITKTTALALLGICSYNFGAVLRFRKENGTKPDSDTNFNTIQFLLTNWVYLMFFLILLFAGSEMLKGNFGSTSKIPSGLLVIFQVSIGLSVIIILSSKIFEGRILVLLWKFNKPVLFILLCFLLLFIYTGDRGPVLQLLLIAIGGFSLYVKKIKIKYFIMIVLLGMFVFTFISYARSKNVTETKQQGVGNFIDRGMRRIKLESFFDMGMDLIVNNRNLYVGVEYANNEGYNYGKSMFNYLFAPVPFLPSIMTEIFFHSPPKELTSAYIITKQAESTYGLGSNIIADLYMAFGVFGVFVFMFFLGYIVSLIMTKAKENRNLNYTIAYLFLLSFSVYLPRTSIFDPFRHIVWAILLFIFLKNLRMYLLKLNQKELVKNDISLSK
jgi:oligosaccharide repeat unit polymerase